MAREREDRGDDRGRGRDRDEDRGRGRDRGDDRGGRGRDRDDDRGRGRDDDDDRGRGRDDRNSGGDRASYGSDDAMRRRAQQQGGNFITPWKAGTKVLRLQPGTTNLRILPPTWENPEHYGYDVWMHSFVGSSGATFLCPKKMLNKPCAACDEVAALKKAGEDKDAKQIEAKQKVVCWAIDRAERKPEPQLWSMSWSQDRDIAEQAEDKRTNTFLKIAGDTKNTNGYDVAVMKKGKGMGTRYTFQIARDESYIEDSEKLENNILKFIEDNPIPDMLVFTDDKTIKDALDGNYSRDEDDEDDDKGRGRGRGRDDDDRGRGRDRDDDRGRGRDRGDDERSRGRRDEGDDDDRGGRGRDEGTRRGRGRGGDDENVREDVMSERANRDRDDGRGRGRDRDDDDRGRGRGRDEEDPPREPRERSRGRDDGDDDDWGGRDRDDDRGRGRDRDDGERSRGRRDEGDDDDRGRSRR